MWRSCGGRVEVVWKVSLFLIFATLFSKLKSSCDSCPSVLALSLTSHLKCCDFWWSQSVLGEAVSLKLPASSSSSSVFFSFSFSSSSFSSSCCYWCTTFLPSWRPQVSPLRSPSTLQGTPLLPSFLPSFLPSLPSLAMLLFVVRVNFFLVFLFKVFLLPFFLCVTLLSFSFVFRFF